MSARVVSCPRCGSPVEWGEGSPWRPFCSQRCRMIDLGAWAREEYRVPTPAQADDGEEPLPDATSD